MKDNTKKTASKDKFINKSIWELLNAINPLSSPQENVESRRQVIKSFKAKADARRTPTEKFADWLTSKFGSVFFLTLNVLLFAVWIAVNVGWLPWVEPFDEFPFGLLTTIVSLEAIILAIIVLVSQNREARVAELREEVELQINTISETEITKIIHLLTILLEKEGVNIDEDPELKRMLRPINNDALEEQLQKELDPKASAPTAE